jgi:hypothetical protein
MRSAAALLLFLVACADSEMEDDLASEPFVFPPVPALPKTSRGGLAYEIPKGWTWEEPKNSLRKAQFRLPDKAGGADAAQLAVFYFGPSRALIETHLGRWAGQMGGEIPRPEPIQGGDPSCTTTLYEFRGTYIGEPGAEPLGNARMLAAVVVTRDGPYYLRLLGPASTVEGWREDFIETLKSARWAPLTEGGKSGGEPARKAGENPYRRPDSGPGRGRHSWAFPVEDRGT